MAEDPANGPEPATETLPPEAIEPDVAEGDAGTEAAVTAVNSQVTDTVTQANATVLGEAPGLALAVVYQSLAQATSLAFLNATQQQQQANMIAQAATAAAVARILRGDASVPVAEGGS
ncbi:MAG TPA: RebB family R body protein [Aliidongia sp.]|nr:RebB family R body protein [Aliidongia sp.]